MIFGALLIYCSLGPIAMNAEVLTFIVHYVALIYVLVCFHLCVQEPSLLLILIGCHLLGRLGGLGVVSDSSPEVRSFL